MPSCFKRVGSCVYTRCMRRIVAAVLLCLVGALLPAATLASLTAPQTLLPVCCRTHGAHACAMGGAPSLLHEHGPAFRSPACPFGQALRAITTVTISTGTVQQMAFGLALMGLCLAMIADVVAGRFLRRFIPRGPPSFLFSL